LAAVEPGSGHPEALVYEVTLQIPSAGHEEFDSWLVGHLARMSRSPAFVAGQVYSPDSLRGTSLMLALQARSPRRARS